MRLSGWFFCLRLSVSCTEYEVYFYFCSLGLDDTNTGKLEAATDAFRDKCTSPHFKTKLVFAFCFFSV